jgi:transposase, IS6 family
LVACGDRRSPALAGAGSATAEIRGLSQIFIVNELLTIGEEIAAPNIWSVQMILNAVAEKLKRQSKDDFKGRHFEARLIVQAVTWRCYVVSLRVDEALYFELR